MDDLLVSSVAVLFYIIVLLWSRSMHYAAEHGYFLAKHRWAQKIVSRADTLLGLGVDFCDNEMEFRISQYLENRVCARHGDYAKRANNLKRFYADDAKILWMLLSVSYEAMLFSNFRGTELSIDRTHPYQEVFDAAASALNQMGYDCTQEIEKCKIMIAETHEFCDIRNFNLYK